MSVREQACALLSRGLQLVGQLLWLDGVYEEHIEQPQRKPRLHRTRAPTSAQLTQLAGTIARRVCRHLTRV